jgi:dTDP-glucose 4,6-dehydratase
VSRRVQPGQPGIAPRLPGPPLETLAVGSEGTRRGLELAHRHGCPLPAWRRPARSTAIPMSTPSRDVLGQREPGGSPERLRRGQAVRRGADHGPSPGVGTDVGIARIFNTYGPRLRPDDGRVVSNFLLQAMRGEALTVYGDGSQTRSLCYVEDEVRGLIALFDSDLTGPVNIGNPDEYTVLELAHTVVELLGSASEIVHLPACRSTTPPAGGRTSPWPASRAGWEPTTELREGLARTAASWPRRPGWRHRFPRLPTWPRGGGNRDGRLIPRPDPSGSDRGDRSMADHAGDHTVDGGGDDHPTHCCRSSCPCSTSDPPWRR